MKTTLVTAAILASSSVFAQSTAEIYGLIDLGVGTSKETIDSTTTKTRSTGVAGTDSESRLGFRGTEDLGGGLKASFVIESTVGSADSRVGSRQTYLSLGSSMGTLTVGKYFNAFDDILTGDGKGDSIVDWVGYTSGLSTNGISYKSPEFGGFTFGLGLSQVQTKVDSVKTVNDRTTELSVTYANGPLSVMAAVGSGKRADIELEFNDNAAVARDPKVSTRALKVSYDLGVAVPYVIYAIETAKTGAITGAITAQNSKDKTTGFEIGASFPMGAFTPYITMARAKNKLYVDGTQLDEGVKISGHQFGINYDMSKRTKLYAVVGSNKAKSSGTTFYKFSETVVGLMHTF